MAKRKLKVTALPEAASIWQGDAAPPKAVDALPVPVTGLQALHRLLTAVELAADFDQPVDYLTGKSAGELANSIEQLLLDGGCAVDLPEAEAAAADRFIAETYPK